MWLIRERATQLGGDAAVVAARRAAYDAAAAVAGEHAARASIEAFIGGNGGGDGDSGAAGGRELVAKVISPLSTGLPRNEPATLFAPAVLRDAEATLALYREVECLQLLGGAAAAGGALLQLKRAYETSAPAAVRPALTLITEYCPGKDLLGRLIAATEAGERITEAEVAAVLRTVARALRDLHALGLVHRDVKPENILLREPAPARMQPVLADLGLVAMRGRTDPHYGERASASPLPAVSLRERRA